MFCTFFCICFACKKYAKNMQTICKKYAKKLFGMALLWRKDSSKSTPPSRELVLSQVANHPIIKGDLVPGIGDDIKWEARISK